MPSRLSDVTQRRAIRAALWLAALVVVTSAAARAPAVDHPKPPESGSGTAGIPRERASSVEKHKGVGYAHGWRRSEQRGYGSEASAASVRHLRRSA